ncbi:MAG: insulinase family protein [Alistipes sp.]|jgi:predicted Zn-dependent peptidase|nr:insulinase family protein [Alistipes sp.]
MIKKQPEIVVPRGAELPHVETVTLPGGLPLHMIRTPGQQVVRVSLVWGAGSAVQSKPFVASSTLNLLSEGSEHLTAQEIAERLDFVGSYFDVSIDRDYAIATFCCLDKFFDPTLEMIEQIVMRPAFPDDEVELYARKRMERLAMERSKPSTKSRELFSKALFGDEHPYGISSPEAEYMNLRREDVVEFRERFYGAGNCFVVCSMGDDPKRRKALVELFSRLPRGGERPSADYPAPRSDTRRTLTVEGAVQSAIRIGRILFPRTHPDFVGMQVVATILGGYFGSRLTQNLREERGYTYGVMAAMVNLRTAGYLAVATEVAAEATDDAVRQIFVEMGRLRTELVGESELENVRRSMLGEVMRILDGPFGMVDVVIENIQIGGARGYIDDFIRQVEATTPERVRELAQKHLDPANFTTVIVGPESNAL